MRDVPRTDFSPKHVALGQQIRRARKDAGLSHDRLAVAVGSSRQHLIRLEHGLHRPADSLLSAIARATGKDIEFFEDGTPEQDEEEAALAADLLRVLRAVLRERAAA